MHKQITARTAATRIIRTATNPIMLVISVSCPEMGGMEVDPLCPEGGCPEGEATVVIGPINYTELPRNKPPG